MIGGSTPPACASAWTWPSRRGLHDSLGPLDPRSGGYGDWDFMLRMCDAGLAPRRLPGLGVCYAIHDANVSTAFDAPARSQGFERFTRKHGLQIRLANHVTIHRLLVSVPEGWSEVDGALEREFTFGDFREAMAFVNRVADLAEAENHHPDIDIRWNRVTLQLVDALGRRDHRPRPRARDALGRTRLTVSTRRSWHRRRER